MEFFNSRVLIKMLGLSILLGAWCAVLTTLVIGLAGSWIWGFTMIGDLLLTSIPVGIFYGCTSGLAIGCLLSYRDARFLRFGCVDEIPPEIFRWRIEVVAVAASMTATVVLLNLPLLASWPTQLYIWCGMPAVFISAIWSARKIFNLYNNLKSKAITSQATP